MVRAEPAIKEGFSRTRSPLCSRYRLNPKFFSSAPVCHERTALSAVALAVNVSRFTAVGNVINVVCVAVLLDELGSGWSAVTDALLTAEDGVTAVTLIVMVADAPLIMVPRRQVTVPTACEQVPWVG